MGNLVLQGNLVIYLRLASIVYQIDQRGIFSWQQPLIKICKKIFYQLKIGLFLLLIAFTGNRLSVNPNQRYDNQRYDNQSYDDYEQVPIRRGNNR